MQRLEIPPDKVESKPTVTFSQNRNLKLETLIVTNNQKAFRENFKTLDIKITN